MSFSRTNYPAGSFPFSVAVGDFNGDGRPDLAVANANSASVSVLLNTSRPALGASAGILSFPGQAVGTAGASQTVTVTNTDAAPLLVSGAQTVGADADEFSKSGDSCTGVAVVAGASCQISVRFTPVTTGAASATLRIVSNAPTSPDTVRLDGTGTAPPPPPAGSPGAPGAPGADGAPGPQGGAGANGTNGTNGATGAKGDAGTNGLNGAAGPAGPKGEQGPQGPAGANGRDALVTCKPGKAKGGKVKVTCTVRFRAASSSTRVRARLARGHRVYASGARAATPGARGSVSLRARRRLARGSYTLLLTFADARGHESVIRQRVSVR